MVVPERARLVLGLIDERFKWGGFDDHDYCARAIEAGMRVFVTDTFFAYHYGSRTISSVPDFGRLASGNGTVYMENRARAWGDGAPDARMGGERRRERMESHGAVSKLPDYGKKLRIRGRLR